MVIDKGTIPERLERRHSRRGIGGIDPNLRTNIHLCLTRVLLSRVTGGVDSKLAEPEASSHGELQLQCLQYA